MNHGDAEDTALHGGEKNERNKIGVNFTTDLSYKERILNPIKEVEDITKMLKDAEYILTRILNPVRSSSSLYEIKKIEETATDNFNRKTENELQKLLSNNPSYDLLIQRTNPPPISYLYDEIEENTPPNNNLYDYDKLTMIQDNVNDPYYPKIENFKALASA